MKKLTEVLEYFSLPLPLLEENCFKKIRQYADAMFQNIPFFKTLNITEILQKANTISLQVYR